VLNAISISMNGVINDEKIDIISKFYNIDAQMLLSEANIFTALHAMQWEFCLSICQTRALWQNGTKICPDFYTIRKTI